MKILMLTYNDWANTGWRFYQCLKLLRLDVQFYKGKLHKFGYPKQGQIDKNINRKKPSCKHPIIINVPELKPLVEQADVIHFTSSTFINTGVDLSDKHVIVQHGGSTYRSQPEKVNAFFNRIINSTIIQCPDLLRLGAKNERLIYYPVDTDLLKPNYAYNNMKVGHFPSTAKTKGTNQVMQTIKDVSHNYSMSKTNLPWKKHLERISQCDIIIETLNPKFDGRAFGEWGNQAIEAAALGKIVITNSLTADLYKKEYGDCKLFIANNQDQLKWYLKRIIAMNKDEILKKKIETRQWVVKNHSMVATAKRLWEKIYGHIDACKT